MSIPEVDAILTGVAAGAALVTVGLTARTIRASRTAANRLEETVTVLNTITSRLDALQPVMAALERIATMTDAAAKATEATGRSLTALQAAIVRDTQVARAVRDVEIAREVDLKLIELEGRQRVVDAQRLGQGQPLPANFDPQYVQLREAFRASLERIAPLGGVMCPAAWQIAGGQAEAVSTATEAHNQIQALIRQREERLATVEREAAEAWAATVTS
ncbi:MAG: hypothetical protein ACYCZN_09730 [Candidatus Dormibacteria bacterium]